MSTIATIAIGLAGFCVGVCVMAGYGFAVAFLTLMREEAREPKP